MYSVTINKEKFKVEKKDDRFVVNGNPMDWDLRQIGDRSYHLIKDQKCYKLELVHVDSQGKTVTVKLNNKPVQIEIKDRFDLLLEKLGMTTAASNPVSNIKAPMPGLILEINVRAGDVIQKGDQLLVLEAMKMENVIKANGDGEVKEVLASPGSSVEKNQVLIIFK
ncbi:MAG TPA: acetyl-CoA carboxylase biotin carboxyl carrier protein subunit [Cyclobacteriaceae bacterium]|nr:acetyl-CoA carboxylase biotin carboxyl carrier protein subunit [Cyclobacteriaceae bacterium]